VGALATYTRIARRTRQAAALVAVAAAIAPAAAAGGVREPPAVRGSLEQSSRDCDHDANPDAITTTCEFDYFAGPREGRTWSADWLQIATTPRPGWCLVGIRGLIRQPGSRLTDRVPIRPSGVGAQTATMRVGPFGTISKRFRLDSGSISSEVTRRRNGIRWRWRGRSDGEKVVVVFGAALSRPVPADPTELVLTQLRSVATTETC
jgi:hypothetical protein